MTFDRALTILFHMRTGFVSTLLEIELGTLEVKGELSDHYITKPLEACRSLPVFLCSC